MEKSRELKHPYINPNNEIKISELTDVHETIDFIFELFTKKNYQTIIISGLNKAIKKVVLITEIIKSKIPGLHQLNEINSLYINNNGINDNEINNENAMPRMSIKLTFIEPSQEEKNNMGYQKPLNAMEANLINKYRNNVNKEDYD
jgi:hypothetical protein